MFPRLLLALSCVSCLLPSPAFAQTKKALADYIERRASAATTQALAEHRKAMKEAATLAFAEQLAPAVRDIARQVELHGNLVRTRLAPVLTALALGVALGIGSAVLWMR